jgi:uncharacterized protein
MRKEILDLIDYYYIPGTLAHEVLIRHSSIVAEAAVAIADRVAFLEPDRTFVEEAAMLHDIGIFYTNAPEIGCTGDYPYVCHGYLGGRLLIDHGMPAHGLVCERHVGVGLDAEDISMRNLPMPARDMRPKTVEETIVCYADTFFSKMPVPAGTMHEPEAVAASLEKFGRDRVEQFSRWLDMFGLPPVPSGLIEMIPGVKQR